MATTTTGPQPQHGGAAPAPGAHAAHRILRVGILQNGKLVEERLIRKRGDVSIGQSSHNTFVVPASNVLSRSFTLFELGKDGYLLNFTEGMDGRIAFDQNAAPLTLLQLRGRAHRKGPLHQLPLPDKSRGKIVVGDTTVLFQFVNAPPVQARPQLPPSVRGSVSQNLDWAMIAIAAVSLFGHVGFVAYVRQIDFPRKPDIEEIPDRFVQMIVPKKEEKKPEKVDPNAAAEGKDEGKKKGEKAKGPAKPRDPEAEARAAAERKARMAQAVGQMGALRILGAKGEGEGLLDTLRGGGLSGDADRVFAQVGGVGVAGTAGVGLGSAKGAGGTGTTRGIGGLRGAGPGEVSTGEKGSEAAARVRGSVKDSSPVDIDGALDPNVVANEIRRRKGAIIACYERALKRNPNLSGKIELQFAVSSVGKVTSADIGTDTLHDDEVSSCITTIVKTWRFPAPEGGEVHFSYPFIFQASK